MCPDIVRTHRKSRAHAILVGVDCPPEVWAVVDHGLVVIPEDVGGGLRGLPQVTVESQLTPALDELLLGAPLDLLLPCPHLLPGLVLHLDLGEGICKVKMRLESRKYAPIGHGLYFHG